MRKSALTSSLIVTLLTALAQPAHSANILFTFVQDDGRYFNDGRAIASYLDLHPDFNVTQRILDDAVYDDYDSFDQIWVYDLDVGSNDSAVQMANYAAIANWFNSRAEDEQNLIADGRILSSTESRTTVSEIPWLQNYAVQLQAVGGGLVLGTDHADEGQSSGVFVDGINHINSLMGLNPFRDKYLGSEAVVDPESPLFLSNLASCTAAPDLSCIRSVTSTSFAPAGEQPSGLYLSPVAFHGTTSTAHENAAVSTTFVSSTFAVDSPHAKTPEPSALLGLFGIFSAGWLLKKREV